MRFRFIREVPHPVKTYEGKRVSTGDVVEFNAWFSEKAMRNPNYEAVTEEPAPVVKRARKKISKKRKVKRG